MGIYLEVAMNLSFVLLFVAYGREINKLKREIQFLKEE